MVAEIEYTHIVIVVAPSIYWLLYDTIGQTHNY